jgi:hypothetical protein
MDILKKFRQICHLNLNVELMWIENHWQHCTTLLCNACCWIPGRLAINNKHSASKKNKITLWTDLCNKFEYIFYSATWQSLYLSSTLLRFKSSNGFSPKISTIHVVNTCVVLPNAYRRSVKNTFFSDITTDGDQELYHMVECVEILVSGTNMNWTLT